MIQERGGAREWTIEFPQPGANLSLPSLDVKPPFLVDASGIDGRHPGQLRSFPGFRSVGLNDSYENSTTGAISGPLLVGPGIDHTVNVPASSGAPVLADLSWKYFPLLATGGTIKFFRYVEFKKSYSSSQVVGGFLMMLPYNGPDGSSSARVASGGGSWSLNQGLPILSGVSPRYVVAFFYWDDATYSHPWIAGQTRQPGWRCRILSNPNYDASISDDSAAGSSNMDVSAWGQYGYLVNPDSVGTGLQYWGSPLRVGSSSSGYDLVQGPAVMYYDSSVGYVRLRSMGAQIPDAQKPYCSTVTDAVHGAASAIPSGGAWQQQSQASAGNQAGKIRLFNDEVNSVFVGVSLYSSTRNVRSKMYAVQEVLLDENVTGPWKWVSGGLALHSTTTDYYDTVELWRSPVGENRFYLENRVTMSSSDLSYSATVDNSGSDDGWRLFAVAWGLGDTTTVGAGAPFQASYRTKLVLEGLSDRELLQQEVFNDVWELTAAPPIDLTRISVLNKVALGVAAKGANPEDSPTPEYVRPWVPSRARWTSLQRPNPENWRDVDNQWYPDEDAMMVYGIVRVGNTWFTVGNRGVVVFKNLGSRVQIDTLDMAVPLNAFSYTVGGGCLWVLTREALYRIDETAGSVTPIAALQEKLFSPVEWARDLTQNGSSQQPSVGIAYDETGNCLYVWNSNRIEALVYWERTGAVTSLQDFVWRRACIGSSASFSLNAASTAGQDDSARLKRAYFCSESGIGVDSAASSGGAKAYWDVYYADFEATPPVATTGTLTLYSQGPCTMHGEAGNLATGSALLAGYIERLTLNGSIGFVDGTGTFIDVLLPNASTANIDAAAERLNRRFNGAIVHLFGPVSSETHVRRTLYGFLRNSNNLRIYLNPALSSSEQTALANGRFVIAPVVFRAMLPPLIGMTDDPSKYRVGLTGGFLDMDVLDVRRVGIIDASKSYTTYSTSWAAIEDAQNLVVNSVGFKKLDDDFTALDSFGPDAQQYNWGSANPIIADRVMSEPGRFREVERSAVVPSRRMDETAFKLKFSDAVAAVAVEMYPSAAVVSLRGMRLWGTVYSTVKRT